jgi:hypothetical protein
MKRRNFYALATALIAFGVAGSASAQSDAPSPPIGLALRLGLFFPTDGNTTSAVGSTWFGFGAEYRLFRVDPTSDLHPTITLSTDYFSRDSIDEVPIMLNYRIHKDSVFASVGAGISFDHTPGNSSSSHFGYQVGIGYDLPVTGIPAFLEAKFWGNDNSNYNGVGVYAGVRF